MIKRWAIGDVVVTAVADIDPFDIPLSRVMPMTSAPELAPFADILVPDHLTESFAELRLAVQNFLVQVDGLSILVDTCVGEHKPRPRLDIWNMRADTGFLDRLAATGIDARSVDIVFCTHLHADHVGWNTCLRDGRWVPTFPNAKYLFGRAEYDHWLTRPTANHGSFADSVSPVVEGGLMELVDDGFSVARGVTLLPLPGHSPGQMGLLIDRGAGRVLFCGDAIHSPLQVMLPHVCSAFCDAPHQAVITRLKILEEAADDGRILVPAHFRRSGRARINRHAHDAFRPVFVEDGAL